MDLLTPTRFLDIEQSSMLEDLTSKVEDGNVVTDAASKSHVRRSRGCKSRWKLICHDMIQLI
jgi:hypothetical protein